MRGRVEKSETMRRKGGGKGKEKRERRWLKGQVSKESVLFKVLLSSQGQKSEDSASRKKRHNPRHEEVQTPRSRNKLVVSTSKFLPYTHFTPGKFKSRSGLVPPISSLSFGTISIRCSAPKREGGGPVIGQEGGVRDSICSKTR